MRNILGQFKNNNSDRIEVSKALTGFFHAKKARIPDLNELQLSTLLAHDLSFFLCCKGHPRSPHTQTDHIPSAFLSDLAHRIVDALVLFLFG